MITIKKTNVEALLPAYLNYAAGLRLVDSFWEKLILESDIYEIYAGGTPCGGVSISSAGMLTSFFVEDALQLRPAFQAIRSQLQPMGAYVVTNDESFLSACFDDCRRLEPQALFFDCGGAPTAEPAYPAQWLRPAAESDLPELEATAFYHPAVLGDPNNQIFVLRNERGEFMGTGHIERMKLAPRWGCVGMYTAPDFRKTGAAQSILLPLIERTREQGLIPIAGCYFGNIGSRRALQNCGMTSKTRFLKLHFEGEK